MVSWPIKSTPWSTSTSSNRGDQTLVATVGPDRPFDYVIAAHVFEHIPFMIDWLTQVDAVLATGGILSLVLPDKRFTFDVNQRVTEFGEVLDAHLRNIKAPTFAQLFDFFAHTVTIDGMVNTPAIWAGTADYSGVVRDDVPDSDLAAYGICLEQQRKPSFVDIHCQVFTPTSFLDIFEKLVKLDLVDFESEPSSTPGSTPSSSMSACGSWRPTRNEPRCGRARTPRSAPPDR